MKRVGYFTAIQHKVSHSTPYSPYPAWDLDLDIGPDGRRRDVKAPRSYGEGTAQGIQAARDAGKPFCLVINVADPHKPLYIFNPWSNGQRIMATATSGTPTYRRLAELARTNSALEARHRLYQLRVSKPVRNICRAIRSRCSDYLTLTA